MFKKEKKAYKESLNELYMEIVENFSKNNFEMIEPINEIFEYQNSEIFEDFKTDQSEKHENEK